MVFVQKDNSNRHYGLLPTKTLIGSFIFMFVFIMALGSGICVIGYTEQDSPTDLSALERASTASPVDEEGGLSVPIRIPRTAPAAAVPKWTVHFARVNTSLICSVIPTTSAEVPNRACWLSFIRLPSTSAAEPDTTVRAMRTMVDQSATAFQVSNGIEERPSQPLKIGTYP